MRIRVGAAGVELPTSPTFTRIRCSMYVSGVVSGSMLTFIVRGPWSIAVPSPVFHESASDAPVVDVPARAVLRLDGEEAARVVLEVVDAEDDDVARAARSRHEPSASGGGLRGLLGLHVRLPIRGAVAPGGRALDRAADAVAGGLERVELLRAAEDGHRDAAVPVVAQIVLVEVDAVRPRP